MSGRHKVTGSSPVGSTILLEVMGMYKLFRDLINKEPEVIKHYVSVNKYYENLLRKLVRIFSVKCYVCRKKPNSVVTTTVEIMKRPKKRYRVAIGCCGCLFECDSNRNHLLATINAIKKWNEVEGNYDIWMSKRRNKLG